MRAKISTLAAALGLALSLWLAALKLWDLPCLSGGCAGVIQSSYGSLLGLPVGIYGAALWLGVFAAPKAGRFVCLALLAAGSLAFTALQIFILHAFCPWCLLHAVAAWTALAAAPARPRKSAATSAIALAAAALLFTAVEANHPSTAARPALAAFVQNQPDALYWLGARVENSPVLVLSLTCPACLDKLASLTQFDFTHHPNGPALYFSTDATNRDVTQVFTAAILAQPGDRREALLGITALILPQRDLILTSPKRAAKLLRELLPNASAREPEAAAILAHQSADLEKSGIKTTPLLITPDGTTRAFFKLEDLLP